MKTFKVCYTARHGGNTSVLTHALSPDGAEKYIRETFQVEIASVEHMTDEEVVNQE